MGSDRVPPARDRGETEPLVAAQRRFQITNDDDDVVNAKQHGALGGEAERDVADSGIKVVL